MDISSLSWSRLNILASASNTGTSIWDINVESPLIRYLFFSIACIGWERLVGSYTKKGPSNRKLPWTRDSSAVEWSPINENQMVAARYYFDLPSVQVILLSSLNSI